MVGEGLIIDCRQARDDLQSLFRANVKFRVLGSRCLPLPKPDGASS